MCIRHKELFLIFLNNEERLKAFHFAGRYFFLLQNLVGGLTPEKGGRLWDEKGMGLVLFLWSRTEHVIFVVIGGGLILNEEAHKLSKDYYWNA